MSKVILQFLKNIFEIREGEIQRASLMQLNIFLIISTLLIVKPTVNGLFLSEIGVENLPTAFVLVAIFAVIISTVYARFLGRIPLKTIILTTLYSSVFLFILFGILLRFNLVGGWILYVFYIWTAIFAVLTASQFWILANIVFNVREAKRLFGYIGAGAIAGGIFGGYLTTLLAEPIGSENMIFLGAALLSTCIPITAYTWKKYVLSTQSRFQRRKQIAITDHPLQLIRRSPHLTYLAGIIGISVIVAKMVDYQFSAIASSKITDPDELTAFFGFWFSNFNVISLLVQLLLTRRIVGTLGVGSSLLFLPVSILTGAILVFFIPELWAAIFIKLSDGSLKQSVNKAGVELLALPIPSDIKNQTKTFIDVVVDSIATGISGLILIFLVNGLDLSTRFISLMILGLIMVWFYFVKRVRTTYLNSFKLNVQKAGKTGTESLDLKNESVISDLKIVMESGSEDQILYVLRMLRTKPDERFVKELRRLLKHPSDLIKEEVIRNLYFLKSHHFKSEIAPFINHPNQKVKIAAFDYLIAHSTRNVMKLMEKYLNNDDFEIRSAALISLAEESRDNLVLKEKFELEKRLHEQYNYLEKIDNPEQKDQHKTGLLKALGMAKMPVFFPYIEEFFKDENELVARQAILSAGDTMHPHFLPGLICFLGKPETAEPARLALIKYGKEIVKPLSDYAVSPEAATEVVQMIPSVAEHFGTQPSADLLFQLLQNNDPKVRLAALRALNSLKMKHSYLNFHRKEVIKYILNEARLYQDTLSILYVQLNVPSKNLSIEKAGQINDSRKHLIQLLETRLDNNLERIFRLLGLKYPPEDLISIYETIQSHQPDFRANVIEYLDNLLEPGLKKVLIPIVETALLDAISEAAIRELNLKIPDEKQCYRLLLSSGDEDVKSAVQNLLDKLEIVDLN